MNLRDAYDAWAPTYRPVAHNALMSAEQDAVTPWLVVPSRGRVLDAGAGTGRYTPVLHAAGAATVVSLDWSLVMLQGQTPGAERVCGDATQLPFTGGVFDLVNASLMAGDVGDLHSWLRELARVLVRGGRLVYSDFHPDWHTRGWRRTFRDAAGRSVELPCRPHTFADHTEARLAAGLRLDAMHEVAVGSPRRLVDQVIGRPGPRVPGLVVVAATKVEEGRS